MTYLRRRGTIHSIHRATTDWILPMYLWLQSFHLEQHRPRPSAAGDLRILSPCSPPSAIQGTGTPFRKSCDMPVLGKAVETSAHFPKPDETFLPQSKATLLLRLIVLQNYKNQSLARLDLAGWREQWRMTKRQEQGIRVNRNNGHQDRLGVMTSRNRFGGNLEIRKFSDFRADS